MVGRKKEKLEKLLTEVELELMNVIWEIGSCNVKDVQTTLPEGRNLAYTSVATIMKILEQKGALTSQKQEKAHIYSPCVSRADYEKMTLRHLTENVFRGDPASMVMRLLDDSHLNKKEVETIRAILEKGAKQ